MRVWEQGGLAGPLTVTLPAGLKVSAAQPVTLMGETTGVELPISEGQLTLELKAYTPPATSCAKTRVCLRLSLGGETETTCSVDIEPAQVDGHAA